MKNRIVLCCCCLFFALHGGCVSNAQFETANKDHLLAIRQCEEKLNSQVESKQIEQKLLTEKIESLNQRLKKQESIISIQETAIRLFDDSEQTLQNSMREQLAAQNIHVSP